MKSNTMTGTETGLGETGRGTVYSILFMASLAHFLNDMMQSVIPSVYPLIKEKFVFSFAQIGIITLVFQLTSSILQPFMGYYMDKRRKPYLLAIGMGFTFIGLSMLAVADKLLLILLAVSIIGWCSSIFHPGASQLVQTASHGRKGLAQSIFQIGGNGGTAVGPLLVALIVIPNGQTAIGWFALAAVLAFFVLCKAGSWYKKQLLCMSSRKQSAGGAVRTLPGKKIRFALFILVVLTFSKYFYLASMTNYFTFFLMDKFNVTIQQSQLCLFAFLLASAVGTVAGGALGDYIGRKYVIWGSVLGAAPFTLALPYVNLPITIVLAVVIGLVISSAFPSILVYATDLIPDKVGTVAGMFFGLSFGLGGIGAAFFGWLADKTGIGFIFQVSTLLPLLGMIAGFLPNIKGSLQRKG